MNTFGRIFRVSIFGESHGQLIGVVLDGVKAGIPITEQDFTYDILRRKSGKAGTTTRIESDIPEIISGIYNGYTTGAPVTIIFKNNNTISEDYKIFEDMPRPGHADYTACIKWHHFNDIRGGGYLSGRLTLPIVAAGVIAKKMLNLPINAKLTELGGISTECKDDTIEKILLQSQKEGDSVGGIVECTVNNVPVGLGEPFFDSVESLLSHAIFSIPGVRGIEFGDGFMAARMKGSEHNDTFDEIKTINGEKLIYSIKNGSGGINGGITNGNSIVFRVAFKPTSSIGKGQSTINLKSEEKEILHIKGRHDVCFALRTPVIVEAMTAIVIADLINVTKL